MRPFIRVIKVGGSLLGWSQLPAAMEEWLQAQPSAVNVLIAGGGQLTDAIWRASQTFAVSEEAAHWLCINAMSITSQLLANIVTNTELVTQFDELRRRVELSAGCRIVFDPNEFLREHESRFAGNVLARKWAVSSDSIAARLAEVLPADELVLLKSSDPTTGDTHSLSDRGYVDEFFLAFARCQFRCKFVNLRSPHSSAECRKNNAPRD